jgi:hypothetical protein
MTLEMIGNANLPCVYTENIVLDETLQEVRVDCMVPDIVDSKGHLLWSGREFLNKEVYLNSMIATSSRDVDNIQSLLYENKGKILRMRLSDIINFDKTQNSIKYKATFSHYIPQELSDGDVAVVSFLSYDLVSKNNTQILSQDYSYFLGPIIIDQIKTSGAYNLECFTLIKNGIFYRGSFHSMGTQLMNGVIHDSKSQNLSKSLSRKNYKLCIISDFSKKYHPRRFFSTGGSSEDYITKPPLWSYYRHEGEVKVRCIFSSQLQNALPFAIRKLSESPLVKYNYFKLIDSITATFSLEGKPLVQNPEDKIRNIRVNHEPGFGELFFVVEGEVTAPSGIINLNININHEFPNDSDLLYMIFGDVESIATNFVERGTNEAYTEFVRSFIKIASCRFVMDQRAIETEKNLLINSLCGNISQAAKERLKEVYLIIYNQLANKFNTIRQPYTYNKTYQSNDRNYHNFKTQKNPSYFDEGQVNTGYLTNEDLITALKERRILKPGQDIPGYGLTGQLRQGPQQLFPSRIITKSVYGEDGLNIGLIQSKLEYYPTADIENITAARTPNDDEEYPEIAEEYKLKQGEKTL